MCSSTILTLKKIAVVADGRLVTKLIGESWVAWTSVNWEELFDLRPTDPVEVRVLCKRVNYYNRVFDDSTKWFAVRLSHPDSDKSIYGYIDTELPQFHRFIADSRQGRGSLKRPSKSAILKIAQWVIRCLSSSIYDLDGFAPLHQIMKPGPPAHTDEVGVISLYHSEHLQSTMDTREIPSTYDKALRINLDEEKYGAFAEIGAGQEVANWFFRASGTAGTVAKTISAYDMTMSDAIYGKSKRYVSRDRLNAMLEYEYNLLVERLNKKRGSDSAFFSFSNTVRARGYQDTGECHGWLGIRLQLRPQEDPCQILIHVRLLDDENFDQMEALGIIGV